ncbi:hypothetical protein HK096_005028 [Nowakowskiella sp. JEL0078]|nr:hypothetical protein HK096_005028 [Nowakowskiella sp. JEL0078]
MNLITVYLFLAMAAAQDCVLTVPKDPLSAKGLATPYTVKGCDQANTEQTSFVEGAVFDPATNTISIYNPLVINEGSNPEVSPVPPILPKNAIVALWFGSNGDTLTLTGSGASSCVNGLGKSVFGQFAYCNAVKFFNAAKNFPINNLGVANDGEPCPTTRDFFVIDQDESDNTFTSYLLNAGKLLQNTAENRKKFPKSTVIKNGSDERLVTLLNTALGCTSLTAPDLADNGAPISALALNELQAQAKQASPIAIVPDNDPMVLVNGKANTLKRNLYRQGVDQSIGISGDPKTYCQNLLKIQPARLLKNRAALENTASPAPGTASNLFTFMCQRFINSFNADNLNCIGLLGKKSPIKVITKNGIAVSCFINEGKSKTTSKHTSTVKVPGGRSTSKCTDGNEKPTTFP